MNRTVVASLMAMSLLVAGCSEQKAWVYHPNDYQQAKTNAPQKVAVVLPFDDKREATNHNRLMLYLIPLMPYGWADYPAPEGATMHVASGLWVNYKPTEEFAKALAQELTDTGRYKEAHFSFGNDNADYVFKGQILNTDYHGTMISYGLCVYGPLFWLIGLPAGTVDNNLSISVACVDTHTNSTVFQKTYSAPPYHAMAWIYDMPNDFTYPDMLKDVYSQVTNDLVANGKCM